jgi:hypothetical protein
MEIEWMGCHDIGLTLYVIGIYFLCYNNMISFARKFLKNVDFLTNMVYLKERRTFRIITMHHIKQSMMIPVMTAKNITNSR